MSKPSWEDAPEWANYLVRNVTGMMLWVWFEYKPFCTRSGVWLSEKGRSEYAVDDHFEERFLEERPTQRPAG